MGVHLVVNGMIIEHEELCMLSLRTVPTSNGPSQCKMNSELKPQIVVIDSNNT